MEKLIVKVPFKAGRLDAKGGRVFRNRKKYNRKVKHPKKEQE